MNLIRLLLAVFAIGVYTFVPAIAEADDTQSKASYTFYGKANISLMKLSAAVQW